MKKMLRVDVYLGDSVYETFFVDKQEEIESRIEGYQMLLGPNAKISYKVLVEDGDAETHDLYPRRQKTQSPLGAGMNEGKITHTHTI